MLGDNIKALRKQNGISQEELASRIQFVIQTISKWEKNLSVPDAAMIQKIAEELDLTVNELLGGEIKQDEDRDKIVEQLVRINEQLVIRNRRSRRIIKTIIIIIAVIALLWLGILFAGVAVYSVEKSSDTVTTSSLSDDEIDIESEVHE